MSEAVRRILADYDGLRGQMSHDEALTTALDRVGGGDHLRDECQAALQKRWNDAEEREALRLWLADRSYKNPHA